MFAQAMEIGLMESVGMSYTLNRRIIERLQAVTAQEVQAVAQKYFNDDALTVGILEPQPMSEMPRPRSAIPRH
jgi:zinc protease